MASPRKYKPSEVFSNEEECVYGSGMNYVQLVNNWNRADQYVDFYRAKYYALLTCTGQRDNTVANRMARLEAFQARQAFDEAVHLETVYKEAMDRNRPDLSALPPVVPPSALRATQ